MEMEQRRLERLLELLEHKQLLVVVEVGVYQR